MTLHVEKAVWTYEDYCELPDDGNRYEVINGELFVSPSPRTRHQIVSKRLQHWLYELELGGRGFVFDAPCDLIMPGCTPVVPDLFFLDPDQAELIQEKFVEGIPRLIVEILSPSTAGYDRVTKLNQYARCGVPHFWIVDPELEQFQVMELHEGRYRIVQALEKSGTFEWNGARFDHEEIFAPQAR